MSKYKKTICKNNLSILLNSVEKYKDKMAIKYIFQIISYCMLEIEMEFISMIPKLIEIYEKSTSANKDYVAIILSEFEGKYRTDIVNEEIIRYAEELLKGFKLLPLSKEYKHLDLYYRNTFIINLYSDLLVVSIEDIYKDIALNNLLTDENFNGFLEYCNGKGIKYLSDLDVITLIESYELKISSRNLGKILSDLVISKGKDNEPRIKSNYSNKAIIDEKKEKYEKKDNSNFSDNIPKYYFDYEKLKEICLKYRISKYKNLIELNNEAVISLFNFNTCIEEFLQDEIDEFRIVINELFYEFIEECKFSDREKCILKLRYRLNDECVNTLESIGQEMGVTRERIRQILAKCNRKIVSYIVNRLRMNLDCKGIYIYYILYFVFKYNNNNTKEKLLLIFNNKYIVQLYNCILELDIKSSIYNEYILYKQNEKNYIQIKINSKKEKKRSLKIENSILNGIVWTDFKKLMNEDDYLNIKQQRAINMKNIESKSGYYYSSKMKKEIYFESQLEQKYLVWLEECNKVKYYAVQPFKLEYNFYNSIRSYYPDIFFVLEDGRAVVVEIKPLFTMTLEINLAKYEALKCFCEKKGYGLLYTDTRNSYEKYKKNKIDENFQNILIKHLLFGPLGWNECSKLINSFGVQVNSIYPIIMRNKIKHNNEPFKLELEINNN